MFLRRFSIACVVTTASFVGVVACSESSGQPADAGSEASARPDTFCFTRPALEFCEDFDEGPLPARFEALTQTSGKMTVEASDPASAPNAGHVTIAAGQAADVVLQKTFAQGTKYRLFLQVREGARSANAARKSSVKVMALRFAGAGDYEIGIGTDESGAWFGYESGKTGGDAAGPQTFAATRPVAASAKWVSVRLDVDVLADGSGTVLIRFGNDRVVDLAPIAPPFARAAPIVRLGAWDGAAANDGWDFRFDNVTFQVD